MAYYEELEERKGYAQQEHQDYVRANQPILRKIGPRVKRLSCVGRLLDSEQEEMIVFLYDSIINKRFR